MTQQSSHISFVRRFCNAALIATSLSSLGALDSNWIDTQSANASTPTVKNSVVVKAEQSPSYPAVDSGTAADLGTAIALPDEGEISAVPNPMNPIERSDDRSLTLDLTTNGVDLFQLENRRIIIIEIPL